MYCTRSSFQIFSVVCIAIWFPGKEKEEDVVMMSMEF